MITAQWNVVIQPRVLASLTRERPERMGARDERSRYESSVKALNLELRFSGSFALHLQIRPTMLSSRRSATLTSRKGFDQDNCG